MIKLFKASFKNKKHLWLIVVTLISMCGLTISSQLEIFSIGILTKKGPDFFDLFGSTKEGKLTSAQKVTKEELNERYYEIVDSKEEGVTHRSAAKFIEKNKRNDLFQKGYKLFDSLFSFSNDYRHLAFIIVAVALIRALTLFFHRLTTRFLSIYISRDLRENYFQHIQRLPIEFYQKHHTGSLSSRVVGDASMVSSAINACLTNYIQTPFTVISTLSLCFLISWKLSLIIFFGFPLIVFPIVFLAKRIKKIAKDLQKNQESFASVLIDFLSGIQTIKLFGMEEYSSKKYQEQNEKMAQLERRGARYDVSSRPIIHTIGMLFLGFALLWGLYVIDLSVSEVLVYCGFLYIFYEPIKKFAEENITIQKGVAAYERMEDVMKIKPSIQDHEKAVILKSFKDQVVFKDVWFKYEDQWVLKGLSFSVKKGQKVAIVGPTGAGKSTIAHLLPRLYETHKGSISIDGLSIQEMTQKSLRNQISFVPQKPFLFYDTIAENISFGKKFTLAEIERSAKMAQANDFIEEMPKKYSTQLSEAGKNLSGGQQQRLAIARALFKQAPILVMDEATSSLDSLSENKIKQALDQLRGKVTQIIIAHRLSTIEDADKIIFIDQGKKIAEGTKDDLLKSCPSFARMWEIHQGKL